MMNRNEARQAIARLEAHYAATVGTTTPADTLSRATENMSAEEVAEAIAILVHSIPWDGRISRTAKAACADIQHCDNDDTALYTNRIHAAHLSQMAEEIPAFLQMCAEVAEAEAEAEAEAAAEAEAEAEAAGVTYELHPVHDPCASFHGKAIVEKDGPTEYLYSYLTMIAYIDAAGATVKPEGVATATSLRHTKEFLRQHGLPANTKAQIMRDYVEG